MLQPRGHGSSGGGDGATGCAVGRRRAFERRPVCQPARVALGRIGLAALGRLSCELSDVLAVGVAIQTLTS